MHCRCNSSDEMHHNRHKDILKLVRALRVYDEENSIKNAPQGTPKTAQKLRRGSAATVTTSTTTDTSSESFGDEVPKLRRRERKKAKKNGVGTIKERNVEAFPREDTDFVSEAIHLSIHESKGAWEGTYNYENHRPDTEQEATQDEEVFDATNQIRALSLNSPNLLTPKQGKTAKKFYTPIKQPIFRSSSRRYSPKATLKTDPYDGVDPQIFFRLGVEIEHPRTNFITRRDLVAKIIAAVKEDLDIIAREDAETAMREEGFWRWAGRGPYDAILRTREELDWATGQKKGTPRRETYDGEIECGGDKDDTDVDAVSEEQSAPKSHMIKKAYKVTLKMNNARSKQDTEAIQENMELEGEEANEDEMQDEMVKRYEQRMAGQRNVGDWNGSANRSPVWVK
jgi:hypothetical protein